MEDYRKPCGKCGKPTLVWVGQRPYCAECFVKATDRYAETPKVSK